VDQRRAITPEDLDGIRRSLAISPHLPVDEVVHLLEDHRLLLLERAELEALLAELEPSFRSVRRVLNRMHDLLAAPGPAPPGTRTDGSGTTPNG
jgi:hypothetical protein